MKRSRARTFWLWFVGLAACGCLATALAHEPIPITVIPFTSLSGEHDAWLSKGIADLLIRDLSEVHEYNVLEREKMQVFLREMGLQESGLFDQQNALRLGQVARVKQVLYGNYLLQGNEITVHIFLLDLDQQKVLQTETSSGKLNNLRLLMNELCLKFLQNRGLGLSRQEREKILFESTDSISATEHFYRAIDLVDRGLYADAFGEFFAATRQDSQFLDAHLGMAKMFEAQSEFDHAVAQYQELHRNHPMAVEGLDALLFSARILQEQMKEPDMALQTYEKVLASAKGLPHFLEASFALGKLYEEKQMPLESYRHFERLIEVKEEIEKDPSRRTQSKMRASRFFTWSHALNLYEECLTKMVLLYPHLLDEQVKDHLPKPPQGVFILDSQSPTIGEKVFGQNPSFFHPKNPHPNWREELYVVIAPTGFVATQVDLQISGKMLRPQTYHSYDIRLLPFPLPPEHFHQWLGAIFGQTREQATLKKAIPFYGNSRRIFAVQLVEGESKIENWQIAVTLKPEGRVEPQKLPPAFDAVNEEFFEGQTMAQIPLTPGSQMGAMRRFDQEFYKIKKEMGLTWSPKQGASLVFVEGDLDGEDTNLWWSQSRDLKTWSEPIFLNINSASDDYNPKFVSAEDGRLWLSWISNRRGLGWELWLSPNHRDQQFDSPLRIPLESFIDVSRKEAEKIQSLFDLPLLEYDLTQDRHGKWWLCFFSRLTRELIILQTRDIFDSKSWEKMATIPQTEVFYGPSLVQDEGGVFRLVCLGEKNTLHLYQSRDGKTWERKTFNQEVRFRPFPIMQRTQLLPQRSGKLLLLVSDFRYGLQFAQFDPDGETPDFDLVIRAGLEPYAAASLEKGGHLIALKEGSAIVVKKYRAFRAQGGTIEKDRREWPIYVEVEKDRAGNSWQRIFAQERMRVPDVTALGVHRASHRIWWGIESGIMYKRGDEFWATDVSEGFFHHLITTVQACGEKTYFASHYLAEPVLGYVENQNPQSFKIKRFPNLQGAIRALSCDTEDALVIGTSQGEVLVTDSQDRQIHLSDLKSPITTLASDLRSKVVWVGIQGQGLFRISLSGKSEIAHVKAVTARDIRSVALDGKGFLWAATENGLWRFQKNSWKQFTPTNSPLLYLAQKQLKADPRGGIWYLPDDDEMIRPEGGLGFFDGQRHEVFHPPHRLLEKTSSMDLDQEGNVWIGTWFDGVFELRRKGVHP